MSIYGTPRGRLRRELRQAYLIIAGVTLVAGSVVSVASWAIDRSTDRAYERGYAVGVRDGAVQARRDDLMLTCRLPGVVRPDCALLSLPECVEEDGTPEGCLLTADDGTLRWVIRDNERN